MIRSKLMSARKNKNLTQKQIADKMAMEQTTYSKKERGLSPIRDDEWVRFAKIFDVNVENIKEDNKINKDINKELNEFAFKTMKKYIQKLEGEITRLKAQVKTLLNV